MAHTRFFGGDIVPWPRATALVVDTDPIYVRGVASLLRDHGYTVLEATTFQEGRRLWDAEHPQVLVADIRLGSFNGLQLLIRARAERSDVSAVITSPVADKVLADEARRFGGTFFVKPVEPKRMLAAIGQNTLFEEEFSDAMLGQPLAGFGGLAPKPA
jgi:two-component system, NarL family, invasion response regulator UvrY